MEEVGLAVIIDGLSSRVGKSEGTVARWNKTTRRASNVGEVGFRRNQSERGRGMQRIESVRWDAWGLEGGMGSWARDEVDR